LRLLENPVLLEHESFTELLRSVFHLSEELEQRDDFGKLPRYRLEASHWEHREGLRLVDPDLVGIT